jgi:hypothetical protein
MVSRFKFCIRGIGLSYLKEYTNTGVGARTSNRVSWPGFHVITSATEAARFTVGQFISGNSWIPAIGVAFTSGFYYYLNFILNNNRFLHGVAVGAESTLSFVTVNKPTAQE